MKSWMLCAFCATLAASLGTGNALATPEPDGPSELLSQYLAHADEHYGWTLQRTRELDGVHLHELRLQSGRWQGHVWEHALSVFVPADDELAHPDAAVLRIEAGTSDQRRLDPDSPDAMWQAQQAARLGSVVAVVEQVPNQPLMGGLYEDALIALSFQQFLNDRGDDWPLLLPMTAAAVRAMDAVQEMTRDVHEMTIEQFVLTGVSKRGWTSWLAAAVDERVAGIVPVAIDMVNFQAQLDHQLATFGSYSAMLGDYTALGLTEQLRTDRGRELLRTVDPYFYREQLNVPVLVVQGTNDPYWAVDAARFYIDQIAGPTHLHYAANVGHALPMRSEATIRAFIAAVFAGSELPRLEHVQRDGRLQVQWQGAEDAKVRATLYRATSPKRDFRASRWEGQAVEVNPHGVDVALDEPGQGWAAYYVELAFEDERADDPVKLSTPVRVVP